MKASDRIVDVIPLVVNSMGWTKGLGADLTRRIEEMIQPTHIFTFDTSPHDGDGDGVEPHGPRVHTLEPVTPPPRFTAADHRALSLLSYFHAVFPAPAHLPPLQPPTASAWDTSLPLCAQPPYELTSRLALDRIVLTGAGAEDVVRTELVRVLAGALVALVSDTEPSHSDNEELYTPGAPPPDPACSNCLGLALVRGVSSDGSKLQLLTPVPPETLVNARVLVMGELRLPVWGWLDFRSADGEQAGRRRAVLALGPQHWRRRRAATSTAEHHASRANVSSSLD
jgi:polynucleotide 5'-hydroxyl-kinase GRC3/NOL9